MLPTNSNMKLVNIEKVSLIIGPVCSQPDDVFSVSFSEKRAQEGRGEEEEKGGGKHGEQRRFDSALRPLYTESSA